MAGSVAEERIRAKAEALLRHLFPDARIVHELVLEQGGVRIDIAAVRPAFLAAIEIKSERDVLTRLPSQAEAAMRVTDLFGVAVAQSHAEKIAPSWAARSAPGLHLPRGAHLLVEAEQGFAPAQNPFVDLPGFMARERETPRLCNPADRLEMLWADELRFISGSKLPRQPAKRLICETMTGREIREAVCTVLRSRHFPRADAALPWPKLERAA